MKTLAHIGAPSSTHLLNNYTRQRTARAHRQPGIALKNIIEVCLRTERERDERARRQ